MVMSSKLVELRFTLIVLYMSTCPNACLIHCRSHSKVWDANHPSWSERYKWEILLSNPIFMHVEQNHSLMLCVPISDSAQINQHQGNSSCYLYITGLIFYHIPVAMWSMLWLDSVLFCLLPTKAILKSTIQLGSETTYHPPGQDIHDFQAQLTWRWHLDVKKSQHVLIASKSTVMHHLKALEPQWSNQRQKI